MSSALIMIYYTNKNLPSWFELPQRYINILTKGCLERGDYDFGPSWRLLYGELQELRFKGLVKHYPKRKLYPFARRTDDDLACFDLAEESTPPKVVIIHDWTTEGWEYRGCFENFEAWLESARNERYLDE